MNERPGASKRCQKCKAPGWSIVWDASRRVWYCERSTPFEANVRPRTASRRGPRRPGPPEAADEPIDVDLVPVICTKCGAELARLLADSDTSVYCAKCKRWSGPVGP